MAQPTPSPFPLPGSAQRYGKVAVVMGGTSAEREVSLMSGGGVLEALLERGIDAHAFDPRDKPIQALRDEGFDRAFLILHGPFGEDGTLQGVLETMGLPYTGCGVMASAIGMDKLRSKLIWRGLGLPVPDFELLDDASDLDAVAARLGLPLFVKPNIEGSSIGVTKVKAVSELRAAYEEARRYDRVVLAEKFVGGGEYSVPILGDAVAGYVVLPAIKIEPATEFYDYQAKYFRDDTVYRCPCLSPEQAARIEPLIEKAFWAIGGRGWGRIDFLMDEAGEPYLLEANTAPGMTSHSLVPMGARAAGMSYEDVVLRILDTTL
ncbi:D-alanine--D-alanine ligase [Chitinimonas koreensis]|uniref:D-alanine--D-alanine ligase n=1 Tax=Chitinimonas koreensis TaxID=356302 RepID=UPI000687EE08|nr:D-alanine--D-alanine ligase [Chitinimonas koreensis]